MLYSWYCYSYVVVAYGKLNTAAVTVLVVVLS